MLNGVYFQSAAAELSLAEIIKHGGVLILRNSSLKLKQVADNAILLNISTYSENISKRIAQKLVLSESKELVKLLADQ